MKTQIEQTALPKLTADIAPDAIGRITLRVADGSPHGDTEAQPIATVYDPDHAELICRAVNSYGALISALRVIGTQAIDFTWTAEQAFLFMRQTARAALETATKGSK